LIRQDEKDREAQENAEEGKAEKRKKLDYNGGKLEENTYPHAVHLIKDDIKRLDSAREHARVGNIEIKPFLLELLSGPMSLLDTLLRELAVVPAREAVLTVPFALAVTHQNKLEYHVGLCF
jgi:hypothetical protein